MTNRRGIRGQDLFYLELPRRKIVRRFTEVRNDCWDYPVAMVELECGHTEYNRGARTWVRCCQCPKEG